MMIKYGWYSAARLYLLSWILSACSLLEGGIPSEVFVRAQPASPDGNNTLCEFDVTWRGRDLPRNTNITLHVQGVDTGVQFLGMVQIADAEFATTSLLVGKEGECPYPTGVEFTEYNEQMLPTENSYLACEITGNFLVFDCSSKGQRK